MPRRVLIIGSGRHDTVGDSYRRTLAPSYEVRLYSPDAARLPGRFDKAARLVARGALGEPLAFALPGMVRAAEDFRPDLILITHIEAIPPRTVERLRAGRSDVRVVGVFSDHLANFERGYFFSAPYDALFFKDRYIVEKLRSKLGFRHAYYLPQACDPSLHRPVALEPGDENTYGCDITLAGNLHYYRAEALKPLLDKPWTVRLWGDEPGRWFHHPVERWYQHRAVVGDEKCRAMRAAKIVLNNNHWAEIAGTNKRTFEVAAIGAFQLTDTPALKDVFEPEREVAAFETQEEMLDKIAYWLVRDDERARMAERAQRRAHAEHTYAHRWAAKLQALGLPLPDGFPVSLDALKVRAV